MNTTTDFNIFRKKIHHILDVEERMIVTRKNEENRANSRWEELSDVLKKNEIESRERKLKMICTEREIIENKLLKQFNTQTNLKIKHLDELINKNIIWNDQNSNALIAMAKNSDDIVIKDIIIRAMTGKNSHYYFWDWLMSEFINTDLPLDYRWTVGNILSIISSSSREKDIRALIFNTKYGTARGQLVFAYTKIMGNNAEDELIRLLTDKDIYLSAIESLGYVGSKKSIKYLKLFIEHPDPYNRKKILKSINKLEKL